jgi:hypothetical protein
LAYLCISASETMLYQKRMSYAERFHLWQQAPTFSRHSAHRRQWSCQPYTPAALYSQEDSWYSSLLEAESNPGP